MEIESKWWTVVKVTGKTLAGFCRPSSVFIVDFEYISSLPLRRKIRRSLISSVKIFRPLKITKYLKYFVTFNGRNIFIKIADKKKTKKSFWI